MKLKSTLSLLLLLLATPIFAQEGNIVPNIEVADHLDKTLTLPHFGQRHLLIFYIDPDRLTQNGELSNNIFHDHRNISSKLSCISILNHKDAQKIPDAVIKKIAAKHTEQGRMPFFIDYSATLSSIWRLGDCNNYTVLILVDPNGQILFVNKGKLSEYSKDRLYRLIREI